MVGAGQVIHRLDQRLADIDVGEHAVVDPSAIAEVITDRARRGDGIAQVSGVPSISGEGGASPDHVAVHRAEEDPGHRLAGLAIVNHEIGIQGDGR